ncbi:MAG: type I methionyl aminopeptidase [Syntrophomonadaceae bacterium]|nr:type I methionyl aminopeptidase [Syntrophomonadaceae bacterium]
MTEDLHSAKLSRNDECWCGSGRKYKKCHLEQDVRLREMELAGIPVPPRAIIKNEKQIAGIRQACQLSKEILNMLEDRIKIGITTADIDKWVYDYTIEHGAVPATLNFEGYPRSVCTSLNNVVCHGIPDDTVLKDGDILNVDVTSILNGYYGDMSRMFLLGDPAPEARDLVRVTRECMYLGIEQVKPFNRIGDIAYAIEQYANRHGFSVVQEYGGHGVGLDFHEEPFVQHYGARDCGMVLVPNMVFTIEPMLNSGGYKCSRLADGWTTVTRDGSLSAQWEHTVRVTETGVEILSE